MVCSKVRKRMPFLTNKEFVPFFNWEILVTKFVDSYSENSWNHAVSSLIDNEKKPIDEDYFCVTEPDSKVPNAPCIFPFHDKGVVYEGCPIDREDKIRRCTMGQKPSWNCITYNSLQILMTSQNMALSKVSVLGVDSLWGDCTFILAD